MIRPPPWDQSLGTFDLPLGTFGGPLSKAPWALNSITYSVQQMTFCLCASNYGGIHRGPFVALRPSSVYPPHCTGILGVQYVCTDSTISFAIHLADKSNPTSRSGRSNT